MGSRMCCQPNVVVAMYPGDALSYCLRAHLTHDEYQRAVKEHEEWLARRAAGIIDPRVTDVNTRHFKSDSRSDYSGPESSEDISLGE